MRRDKEPIFQRPAIEGTPIVPERYLEIVEQETVGLLCEGLSPRDMGKVMEDPRTIHLVLRDSDMPMSWPLTTPISNNSEYSASFFDDHTSEGRGATHYLSLPPERLVRSPAEQAALGKALYEVLSRGALLVYDEYDSQRKDRLIQEYLSLVSDAVIDIDDFIDPRNKTPAATVLFSTPIRLSHSAEAVEGASKLLEEPLYNTHLLGPERLDDTLMDKLWNICEPQFTELTKHSPIAGLASRDEFNAVLKNPGMRTIVHFEDGEPVAAGTLAVDIKACTRLNVAYYEQAFPGEELVYFISLASAPNRKGALHSMDIAKLFAQLTVLEGEDFRLLYACTNISAKYIRMIAERVVTTYEKLADAKVEELGKYNYRGVRLAAATDLPESLQTPHTSTTPSTSSPSAVTTTETYPLVSGLRNG